MRLLYLHEFLSEYADIDAGTRKQIRKKLDELPRTPFDGFPHQPLKGEQFKGLYKYRVGDWRLIYQIRGDDILFITLGHRSEVYR